VTLSRRRPSFARAPSLKRYQRIVSVLARHGFGSFLETLQLERRIPLPARLLKAEPQAHLSPAEHLRLALEELGPAFVKLGQILSTRPDLLGPADVAKALGVPEPDVMAILESGELAAKKIGSSYRVTRAALEKYLAS